MAPAMDPERSVSSPRDGRAELLVPIKGFARAKLRLAQALDESQRSDLARAMAARVLAAAAPFTANVVCDDMEVARWADQHDAEVIWCPTPGLNESIAFGVRHLQAQTDSEIVISHADLPLAQTFEPLVGFNGVTLVPDRHGGGTNVLCLPSATEFNWHYGPGSFAAHRAEAVSRGLAVNIVALPELQWDVDTPDDLDHGDIRALLSAMEHHL